MNVVMLSFPGSWKELTPSWKSRLFQGQKEPWASLSISSTRTNFKQNNNFWIEFALS